MGVGLATSPSLDRVLLTGEQEMSWPAKVVPVDPAGV